MRPVSYTHLLFGAVRGAGASVSHLTVSGNIKLGGRVTYVAGIAGYVAGKNSDEMCIRDRSGSDQD